MSRSGTRVVLVRHGESQWHAENRYAGISDVGLTEHGRDQGRELARWAEEAGLAAVWSSPLARARQTAQPCAEAAGTPLGVDARLRELDFGVAEGLTRAEMRERFPSDVDAFVTDPVEAHFPRGEDPREAVARFTECLAELAERAGDGRVLVVAHSTVIRLALCRLLGIDPSRYRDVMPDLGNCALSEVGLDGDHASLLSFNAPPLAVVGSGSRR